MNLYYFERGNQGSERAVKIHLKSVKLNVLLTYLLN